MDKKSAIKVIKANLNTIDFYSRDIKILQIKINNLELIEPNKYFKMLIKLTNVYENYTEAVHLISSKALFNCTTDKKIQELINNTKITVDKVMLIRELAKEKLKRLEMETITGGVYCG